MSLFTILVIFLQHRSYDTIFGIKDFQSIKTHCNERKAWNNGSGLLYCTLPYCKCLTLALDGPFLESPGNFSGRESCFMFATEVCIEDQSYNNFEND